MANSAVVCLQCLTVVFLDHSHLSFVRSQLIWMFIVFKVIDPDSAGQVLRNRAFLVWSNVSKKIKVEARLNSNDQNKPVLNISKLDSPMLYKGLLSIYMNDFPNYLHHKKCPNLRPFIAALWSHACDV